MRSSPLEAGEAHNVRSQSGKIVFSYGTGRRTRREAACGVRRQLIPLLQDRLRAAGVRQDHTRTGTGTVDGRPVSRRHPRLDRRVEEGVSVLQHLIDPETRQR